MELGVASVKKLDNICKPRSTFTTVAEISLLSLGEEKCRKDFRMMHQSCIYSMLYLLAHSLSLYRQHDPEQHLSAYIR